MAISPLRVAEATELLHNGAEHGVGPPPREFPNWVPERLGKSAVVGDAKRDRRLDDAILVEGRVHVGLSLDSEEPGLSLRGFNLRGRE